jgi:hypothetical protein
LLSLELSHLLFWKRILVAWIAFEWKRIDWELWMFFMINIIHSILPIRKLTLICTFLLARCIILNNRSFFSLLWFNFKCLEWRFISSFSFHLMRVYDFVFFLNVECFLLWTHLRMADFRLELFLVVGYHLLWVRILHKPVWTSSLLNHCIYNIEE